jgi:hypothetical protein
MIEPVQTSDKISEASAMTPFVSNGCTIRELPLRTNSSRSEGFQERSTDYARTRRDDRTLALLGHIERLVSSVAQLVTAIINLKQKDPPARGTTSNTPSYETSPVNEPDFTKPIRKLPSGSILPQSGEFLWKPVSERDHKLVILLPSSISSSVTSVQIVSPKATKVLEVGSYSGIGNGDRAHFRFKKPGGSYPDGSIVLISLKDGSKRHVTIKNTEARFTK